MRGQVGEDDLWEAGGREVGTGLEARMVEGGVTGVALRGTSMRMTMALRMTMNDCE